MNRRRFRFHCRFVSCVLYNPADKLRLLAGVKSGIPHFPPLAITRLLPVPRYSSTVAMSHLARSRLRVTIHAPTALLNSRRTNGLAFGPPMSFLSADWRQRTAGFDLFTCCRGFCRELGQNLRAYSF